MKKFLSIILSLVLAFTLVAVVACDNTPNNVGGNNFKEVELTEAETREEFVNTLSEKIDAEALIGDPTAAGWTFGLEQKAKSKIKFEAEYSMTGTSVGAYTANGNVEINETVQNTYKGNGANAPVDFAALTTASVKGNIVLSDTVYAMINALSQELAIEGVDVAAIVKSLITNFNYEVKTYADKDVALIELSEGLYNKLPQMVTELLGSRKLKIDLSQLNDGDMLPEGGDSLDDLVGLIPEDVKVAINELIDNVLLQYKISVGVSTKNGYALKLTVNQQSILAILNDALADVEDASLVNAIKNAIGADSKFEIVLRIDEEGAFAGISVESTLNVNFNWTSATIGVIKVKVNLSGSVEINKFNGTIAKPDAKDYTEIDLSGLIPDDDFDWDGDYDWDE